MDRHLRLRGRSSAQLLRRTVERVRKRDPGKLDGVAGTGRPPGWRTAESTLVTVLAWAIVDGLRHEIDLDSGSNAQQLRYR